MNLRTIRILKKIDAEEAAKALGIKTSLLYSYESGRVKVKDDFLKKAANYYGVTVGELLEREELKTKDLLQTGEVGFWKGLVEEYKEREKGYRTQIEFLMGQLGKPTGDLDAIVSSKSGKCRVVRLQPRLHQFKQCA